MTQERAASLLNSEDSLQQLYVMNSLLEDALRDSRILVNAKTETLENLMFQKIELQRKIEVIENRLDIKSDKITLCIKEVHECSIALDNANKKLKKQKIATTVTTIIGSTALVAVIVTVLIIAL